MTIIKVDFRRTGSSSFSRPMSDEKVISPSAGKRRNSVSRTTHRPEFLVYMSHQIDLLRAQEKFGTVINYQAAYRSFSAFLDGRNLSVTKFTSDIVEQYNLYLIKRKIVKNSISFYMRILRAVYNKAVKEKLVSQTFPFSDVYTGVDKTKKRATTEKAILKLASLDLTTKPQLALARDLFVFSYSARGMAFVDMAYLKKANIINGIMTYRRRKTDQLLSVRIEPCMNAIIKHYQHQTKNTSYVFPMLTTEDPVTSYKEYYKSLSSYNRYLRILSQQSELLQHLSSYTARHTWATEARNHHIPISMISAGMGHTSEKTTQIYLDLIDNAMLDKMNRGLLKTFNQLFQNEK